MPAEVVSRRLSRVAYWREVWVCGAIVRCRIVVAEMFRRSSRLSATPSKLPAKPLKAAARRNDDVSFLIFASHLCARVWCDDAKTIDANMTDANATIVLAAIVTLR